MESMVPHNGRAVGYAQEARMRDLTQMDIPFSAKQVRLAVTAECCAETTAGDDAPS